MGELLQQDILNSRNYPVEATILEGPHKGQTRRIAEADLVFLVKVPVRLPLRPGDRVLAPVAGLPLKIGDNLFSLSRDSRLMVVRDAGEQFEVKVLPPSRLAGKVGLIPARDHRFKVSVPAKGAPTKR